MARIVLFLLFSLAAFGIASLHWPALRRRIGVVCFALVTALGVLGWVLPLLMGLGVHGNVPGVGLPLKMVTATWMVTCLITVTIGGPLLLVQRLAARIKSRRASPPAAEAGDATMSRRSLLKGVGQAVPAAAVMTGVGGVANTAGQFKVKREEVRIKGLPAALDGFRIGQITDIHVGTFIDAAYVRAAVHAMNAEGVELQVMTGDLIDDLNQLDATFDALCECAAIHGMLAVLGNHEHWAGLRKIRAKYDEVKRNQGPLRLLVDESVLLEHNGTTIRIVGTDFPNRSLDQNRAEVMRRQAEIAFVDARPDETTICLAHHPDFFPHAAEKGANLTLSGHTHGGQVALLGIPAFGFVFKYMLGRYRAADSHLYVSGGTGHWLPFRIGVPAEVSILTLRSA